MSTSARAQQNVIDSLVNISLTQELPVEEKALLYGKICERYVNSNPDSLLKYSTKGLELAKQIDEKNMMSNFVGYIGIYHYYKGDYDAALSSMEEALVYAIEADSKASQGRLYTNMALMYGQKGEPATEIEYNLKALTILEEVGNDKMIVTLLVNIGTTYHSLHDDERALLYFDRAAALSEKSDFNHGRIISYYGYGNVYYDAKEYDKSLECYLKSLDLSREENNAHFETLCVQSLSTLYLEGYKDLDMAEKYANESLGLAEQFGDPFRLRGSLAVIANLYLHQNRYRECYETAIQAWAIDSVDLDLSHGLASMMAISNIHLGNKERAEYFLDKYIELNGEKNKKSLRETLIGMEVKYEAEKKELQIEVLKKEKSLYIWVGLIALVALVLIIFLLLFRYRYNVQKRKLAEQENEMAKQQIKQLEQEKQLVATQAILDGETAERSRLARDLHDGLGGMLSVVKLNLKDMKSFSIVDGTDINRFNKALEMLDQSIGELRRVAHHMMPESLMRYGLKVSLEDFCRAIPGANFQYLGGNPRLDSQLEVLIYRCAYELVNNAVKYAQATKINVQLMIDSGVISLTVHDNGIGFDPEKVSSGTGLENLRTRVSAYNGKFTVISSPSKGSEISIEIESQT